MPYYHSLGSLPHKRHTQFRKPDGKLYAEELFSTEGFSNDYSLMYHCHPPTDIIGTDDPYDVLPVIAEEKMLKHRSFEAFKINPKGDFLASRKTVLVNNDCHIVLAAPELGMNEYFYKNADADELIFIHEGSGVLKTMYGNLEFGYGDYLIVPRGTIYQLEFKDTKNRLFIVESFSPIEFPKRYLNKSGQLMEHAPFCERDIKLPGNLKTRVIKGYNNKRSGPITFMLEPGWYGGAVNATGTTHGTWNNYDAHIPLLWMGWGIKHGTTNRKINMTDISATLASLLHIQMPSGCIGEPIEEVLKK